MSSPTDRPLSATDYANLKLDQNIYSPEAQAAFAASGPFITKSEVWGDFLLCSYQEKDGATGFAMTNGKCAFHVDTTNNLIFSAGSPGQAGCGGKMVFNGGDTLQKTTGIAIEVTGKANTTTKEQTDAGDIEDVANEVPYSLKVYGDVKIEAIGGEVQIAGDNVTVNGRSSLNLVSGKDITLQAGNNGGKINLYGGEIYMDAAFLKKKISGGEYTDGAGEVKTDQYKPGSTNTITSTGSLTHNITGDYELGVLGDYRLGVTKNYALDVTLDAATTVKKSMSTLVFGRSKLEVQGLAIDKGAPTGPNYELAIGPNKGASEELPAFQVKSQGSIGMESTIGGFKLTSGAKALSELSFNETEGEFRVGPKLGSLKLGPESASLSYLEVAKLNLTAAATELKGTLIFLN